MAQLEFHHLALFIMMLPKAHLISHSRMSGSSWAITTLWLSGSLRYVLYSSSVHFCYIFLTSASFRSIPYLSFIVPIFAWKFLLVSLIILKWSLVFPILSPHPLYFFTLVTRKAFLSKPFSVLWNSAFRWTYISFSTLPFTSILFSIICKASSDH